MANWNKPEKIVLLRQKKSIFYYDSWPRLSRKKDCRKKDRTVDALILPQVSWFDFCEIGDSRITYFSGTAFFLFSCWVHMSVFGTKWNWFDRRGCCGESPGSLHPVSETAWETVLGSLLCLESGREGNCSLGLLWQLDWTLPHGRQLWACQGPAGPSHCPNTFLPACLPPSVTWSVTPGGWLHPPGEVLWEKQDRRDRKLNTDHGWIVFGVEEGGRSVWGEQCFLFSLWGSGQVFKKGIDLILR